MPTKLEGHTAIISGGLGDIGRAIARTLARHGANIAIGDIREASAADALLAELTGLNVRARYNRVDVSDPDAVHDWIDNVERDLGVPDLIVSAAAIATFTGFDGLTAAQWRRELTVNLDGAFHLTHAASQRLIAHHRPGRIVLIGSWAGGTPQDHIPAYCVSKAGLRMLAKCLALSLARHDILVNEVAPGYVDAGLTAQAFAREPSRRDRALEHVPVRRLITAEQVADQVLFLCDAANVHMTGATLLIDGGLSLLSRPR